jgi:hypothetical protein
MIERVSLEELVPVGEPVGVFSELAERARVCE